MATCNEITILILGFAPYVLQSQVVHEGRASPYSIPRTAGFKFSPQQSVNSTATLTPLGCLPRVKARDLHQGSMMFYVGHSFPRPGQLSGATSKVSHINPGFSNISRLLSQPSQCIIFNVNFPPVTNQNHPRRLRKSAPKGKQEIRSPVVST